jgi:GcrA cell cycle regulator
LKKNTRRGQAHPKLGFPLPRNRRGELIKLEQPPNSTWSEEMVIDLLKMWNARIVPSEVAVVLTQKYTRVLTRSAVIGKLSRMGLATAPVEEPAGVRNPKSKETKPASANPFNTWTRRPPREPRVPRSGAYVEVVVPEDQRKTLMDLDDSDCRWPIGDPRTDDFHFCGARKVDGASYCAYHLNASAYEPREGVAAPYPLDDAEALCDRIDSVRDEVLEEA